MDSETVTETYTLSEFRAAQVLYGRYYTGDIHQAADEIILLAEKIKAERATAAMQHGQGTWISKAI